MRPRRIVSLSPAITETLVALGAGRPRLVAATIYCTRPKGMLWGLPTIGTLRKIDVARVKALKPDLVFASAQENRYEDLLALREVGIEVDVTFSKRVADVPPLIQHLGERMGERARAKELAGQIEAEFGKALSDPPPGSFRYAFWLKKNPWTTISKQTYTADLLRLAGGINVFGTEAEDDPKALPAQALARGATVHFFPVAKYAFHPDRDAALVESLFGKEVRRIFELADDYLWPGVRTLEALETVKKLRVYGT